MMIDEKILTALRSRRAEHISSEELRKDTGISRTAIWKHIEKLRDEGYEIEASPHLGYRLIRIPDALIPAEIKWRLKSKTIGSSILSYASLDSTNDAAYALAEKGIREGAVIFAEEQRRGKGRAGREWVSPPLGGIYMSCILRPRLTPNEIARITLLAAVSVAKAIQKFSGLSVTIKWPNDILIRGKKVCGILTEMKAQLDSVDFIVLGIGVNVNSASRLLPKGATSLVEELSQSARGEALSRIDLARVIIEMLDEDYHRLAREGFGIIVDEWKSLSHMIGSRVRVLSHDRQFDGQAHDIDMDGSLIVRCESGILKRVTSGDILLVR